MAFNLLGMFQPQPSQMQTLLGEYYDPKAARMAWLGGALQAAGAGLASGRPGAWAVGLGQGGTEGTQNYNRRALAQYGIAQAKDEKDYRRGRDAKSDADAERDYLLRKAEYDSNKAWQGTLRQRQLEQWDEQDALKQGQQTAVEGFNDNFTQQGGDLFSPGMQGWLRGQGVSGVNPADTQRYNSMQPYVQAGDYGGAFQQMTAPQEGSGPNWKETTLEDGVYWVDQKDPSNRIKMGERPNRNEGEGRGFTQEKQLRGEYMTEAKPFTELRVNYQKVQGASQDNTGASDISLVYAFMKMLDPTSVVREGEFATAANAGGVDARVISLYNSALNGQKLSPQVRQEFVQQAGRQYQQQAQTYQQIKKKYEDMARQYNLDPALVAPDITYGVQVMPGSTSVDALIQQYGGGN